MTNVHFTKITSTSKLGETQIPDTELQKHHRHQSSLQILLIHFPLKIDLSMESVNGTCTFRSPPLRSIEMKEMKMNVFLISSLCYGSRCCFVPVVTVKKAPSFFARRGRQAPSLCHRYVTKHLSVCTVVCPCWFQQHNNIECIIQSWILQMDYYSEIFLCVV